MKPSPRPSWRPSRLSDSVHHRLNAYALAASAVGVGTLALCQASEAKIVYTPANTPVDGKLHIDLNHDGIWDFFIHSTNWCGSGTCAASLAANGSSNGNGIVYKLNNRPFASALKKGAVIGAKQNFNQGAFMLTYVGTAFSRRHYGGYWANVTNRYLGLKFQIKGKTHYGWARFTAKESRMWISAVLTGYAYETIPGKRIVAGTTKGPDAIAAPPGSLGRLALGRK